MQRTIRNERENEVLPVASQRQDAESTPESEIIALLTRIESKLDAISQEKQLLDFYSIEEFAKRVNRSNFSVREWARLRRVNAEKRPCGRGNSQEWQISHAELLRYLSHGLLPDRRRHY